MLIEVQQLQQVMTELSAEKAAQYAPLLSKWCAEFEINTPRRIAAFLATIAEESGELRHWRENLNYSAERLVEVWPRRFPNLALAKQYERNPRKLANFIYTSFSDKAKELGNRPNSDDGWLYRGGGPGQATGRQMYADLTAAIGEKLGVDLVKNPERIEEPEIGIAATCWIWAKKKNLNWIADSTQPVTIKLKGRPVKMPPFQAITRLWNGGEVGLRSRMAYLVKATDAMEVNKI
jgi:putative chitinase